MAKFIYKKWHAAFADLLKKEKRGIQTRLANKLGISNQHISDVLRGRRDASQELQEQLSRALGKTYEEMLQLGGELRGGEEEKEPFENYNRIMRLPIVERGWAIMRQAAEVHGVTGYLSAMGDERSGETPKFLNKFLAGEQTEEELYEEMLEFFADAVKRFRQAIKEKMAGKRGK